MSISFENFSVREKMYEHLKNNIRRDFGTQLEQIFPSPATFNKTIFTLKYCIHVLFLFRDYSVPLRMQGKKRSTEQQHWRCESKKGNMQLRILWGQKNVVGQKALSLFFEKSVAELSLTLMLLQLHPFQSTAMLRSQILT